LKPLKGRGKGGSGKALKPVRPNAGIEAAYRAKLVRMTEELHRSVLWWVRAAYRKNPPTIAQDAAPVQELIRLIRKLRARWLKNIDDTAPKIAAYFDQAMADRSDAALKKILRDGGFSVRFQLTAAMRDVRAASIAENVSLIRSIPSRYFDEIEGLVMRGFSNGYDLKKVTDDLQGRFNVTRKRAAFIARDQSSKLNASYTRARFVEIGIKEAVWTHSTAGKEPRYTHLHVMNGERFDIAKGMYDPDPRVKAFIQPGALINCRCVARPVIPGFS